MRVLVLSAIHANLVALETVLTAAEGQYDTIWCLGDIVGYGPRPNECVALMRERASLCVMGNHDLAAVGHPEVDVDNFNPHARQAVLWTRETLTPENSAYLAQRPDRPIQPPDYAQLLVTHASPREPVWEYILTPNVAWENFAFFSEQICLVGHTHKPAIYRWRTYHEVDLEYIDAVDDSSLVAEVTLLQPPVGVAIKLATADDLRVILNPGSVGQPRDNDARAAYALLDLDEATWRYERVPYPIELTQSQMRAANLPRRLIDRLSYGW
ncbi:MAG TPA: metallophosphoesterase family protein [Caldilineaceae bacterium]|nr:metallophosphoesterase family protein [Caldilineaceae bacterium]